jgi:hypothetical protein
MISLIKYDCNRREFKAGLRYFSLSLMLIPTESNPATRKLDALFNGVLNSCEKELIN